MSYQFQKGSTQFQTALASLEQMPVWFEKYSEAKGLCFCGRSNVGKSSLMNTLLGKQTARTSKTPGRTREINVFDLVLNPLAPPKAPPLVAFDLPGYGHAVASKEQLQHWGRLIESFFEHLSDNFMIVAIQDARHPDQKVDRQFFDFINQFGLPTTLLFNKIDKLKTQKSRAELMAQQEGILSRYQSIQEVHFVSAESKQGLDKLELFLTDFLTESL